MAICLGFGRPSRVVTRAGVEAERRNVGLCDQKGVFSDPTRQRSVEFPLPFVLQAVVNERAGIVLPRERKENPTRCSSTVVAASFAPLILVPPPFWLHPIYIIKNDTSKILTFFQHFIFYL